MSFELLQQTSRRAVWTDDGRDDSVAEIGLETQPDGSVRVLVDAPRASLSTIALRWDRALPARARVLGDHWERGYGDLEWRGIAPERVLPWYAVLFDEAAETTIGFGVETGAGALAAWRIDETGVTLVLDLRCGGMGVRLGSRTLLAATLRFLESAPGETPFAFCRRFCQALCRAPRLSEPGLPVYGGNDWYHRYGQITAETVRQDSGAIRELSPSTGNAPSYVIDAGWFAARGAEDGGPYDRGHDGFPDMAGLAAWMRGIGVRPGIWVRPLLTTAAVPKSWRVPAGHPRAGAPGCTLDPSVPEVLALVRADIARLAGWGYTLIKHDFTTYDMLGCWGFEAAKLADLGAWTFADRSRTTVEIVRELYEAIRDAADGAQLIGCNTIGHLAAGTVELQRTGDDTSGKHWERTRKMGINTLAFRMPQHEAFFHADADCVGLTRQVPWEQNRQWLDLVARSGTPLFVSIEPEAVGPEQKAALRTAFERAATPQPGAEPLDWLATTCPRRWRAGEELLEYDWATFPDSAVICPP